MPHSSSYPGMQNPPTPAIPRLLKAFLATLALCLSISGSYGGSGTWVLNPVNNDWDTAANWSSNTVPGPLDTATFGVSNVRDIVVSAGGSVNGIIFSSGADAFQITAPPAQTLMISNVSIQNESDTGQNFVATVDSSGNSGAFELFGGVVMGGPVTFTAEAPIVASGLSAVISFVGTASAGSSTIINEGAL